MSISLKPGLNLTNVFSGLCSKHPPVYSTEESEAGVEEGGGEMPVVYSIPAALYPTEDAVCTSL